jgi:L-aminopeptidase/D-esterase-like protein
MGNGLLDVPGLQVGHWTHAEAQTGCTVILCGEGAVCGVDVRGGSPGTRETDLLDPTCTVDKVHAVLLAGGSAFGLAATDGVMRWLEERGIGFDVGVAKVPIVPAAILFDLLVGDPKVRPDAAAGYAACEDAIKVPRTSEVSGIYNGSIGAGTGATVGKALGPKFAMKGGLGQASISTKAGLVVGALAVVNAFGNVHDLQGKLIAGARNPNGAGFADSVLAMSRDSWRTVDQSAQRQNTTLAVVATNAALTKSEATKVAQMAQTGLARVIRPAHSPLDGDVVFALSTSDLGGKASVSLVGALAAEVLSEAIVMGVNSTDGERISG